MCLFEFNMRYENLIIQFISKDKNNRSKTQKSTMNVNCLEIDLFFIVSIK